MRKVKMTQIEVALYKREYGRYTYVDSEMIYVDRDIVPFEHDDSRALGNVRAAWTARVLPWTKGVRPSLPWGEHARGAFYQIGKSDYFAVWY